MKALGSLYVFAPLVYNITMQTHTEFATSANSGMLKRNGSV